MSRFFYLKYLILFSLIASSVKVTAQLPVCDRFYLDKFDLLAAILGQPGSNELYTYDPALPVSATNPTLNTITINPNHGGLTVSAVLGSANTTRTFYTTLNGKYWYYDPVSLTWVNTGHSTGNPAAVNLGAGGGYIFNLVGATGEIYRYDGTGNGSLLITINDFIGEGPYDLIADCDGNFYVFNATGISNPTFLRKYSPNGVMLQQWSVINPNVYEPAGGVAIVGNSFYTDHLDGGTFAPAIASGMLVNNDLNLNAVSTLLPQYGPFIFIADLGSCDAAIPIYASLEIAASDTIMCKTRKVDFWVTDIQNHGSAPTYQWFVNGTAVAGATDTFYAYSPQNGDVVTCQMVSSKLCVVTPTVLSNPITMVVEEATPSELSYNNDEFCLDFSESVLADVSVAGGTFSASPGGLSIDPATGEITPSLSAPGEYVVTYLNPVPVVCPQYSTSSIIKVYPLAEAEIEIPKFKQPGCINDIVALHAKEASGNWYKWEPETSIIGPTDNPVASVSRAEERNVFLTVYAKGGCLAKDSVLIPAGKTCCRIFQPSAFTPNGDGFNDVFEISTRDVQAIVSFRIYNRYGQIVFETNNNVDAWDGKYKGIPCDIGVYYYLLVYSCDDGKIIQKKGEVTLIK